MTIRDDIITLCDPRVEFDYEAWGRVHDHIFRRHYWLLREYYAGNRSIGICTCDAFSANVRRFLEHTTLLTEVRACPECGEHFGDKKCHKASGGVNHQTRGGILSTCRKH